MMDIDRIAISLSRRRLIGAGLFAAISALVSGGGEDTGAATRTPRPPRTPKPTRTPVVAPTTPPTETATETTIPSSTIESTATVMLTEIGTETVAPTVTASYMPTNSTTSTMTPTSTPTVTPTATATPTPTAGPVAVDRVLLARYEGGGIGKWENMRYRPRQWVAGTTFHDQSVGDFSVTNAGSFSGWDFLETDNEGSRRVSALTNHYVLTLNRSARVGVIWREAGYLPAWLQSWTNAGSIRVTHQSGGIGNYPVYTKDVPAGDVILGGMFPPDANVPNVYWVILAESGGHPALSPDASVSPNATCPSWLHDSWGPAWHPQIDPTHWCYYRHDHGTNPAYLGAGWNPTFGAVATKAGMSEGHAGFKIIVFDDASTPDLRWGVHIHQGSASLARVCVSHHTLEVIAVQPSTGAVLADVQLMANFGQSRHNETETSLSPVNCPDQDITSTGSGTRLVPVQSWPGDGDGPTFYEPWRTDNFTDPNLPPTMQHDTLGMAGNIVVNVVDQILICAEPTCASGVLTGGSGTNIFITDNDFGIATPAHGGGSFCTDPMGIAVMDCGDSGAVSQYVATALSLVMNANAHCADALGWSRMYVCGTSNGNSEREQSIPIGGPN